MKISKETMDILKNFAQINKSILVQPGSRLKTITPTKLLMAYGDVQETWPLEFAIYDLNQFLGTASLFENPDFEFGPKSCKITSESGAQATFMYAAKEAIVHAPDKDVILPSSDVKFVLEEKALQSGLKAASVMGLPNIALVGRGDAGVFLTATDMGNDSNHSWETRVGDGKDFFKMIYKTDLLTFLPRDYEVTISKKLISQLKSKRGDVTYFTAALIGSTFT